MSASMRRTCASGTTRPSGQWRAFGSDKRGARPRSSPRRAGDIVAGLVASWIKALSEPRVQAVAERVLPPSPAQKLEVGADPSGHPENMPPAVIVGRVAKLLHRQELSAAQRVRAQWVIHYTTGVGLGAAYGAAAKRWPQAAKGRGALAGLVIYALTHGSLLPVAGIQRPPWRLAPAAVAWETISHVIFGASLETVRRVAGASR
jgi:putative membrane protein